MKTLTEQFNTIAVRKGDFFAVELSGNASTGYLWEVSVTKGQAEAVRRDALPVSRPGPNGEMPIGGGNVERTIWQAQSDGVIELKAEYRRPWEKGTPPAKSLTFTVKAG
ncbi:MAG: hypothetical protein GC185_02445 [Alphaproteobacteria bacterium]|nr:hypothetical protein [Alphaproteobacteria bacterium]